MIIFISIVSVIIVDFFLIAAILFGVSKLFKISEVTYKKSILITIIFNVACLLLGVIIGIINLGFFTNILGVVGSYFVFYYVFRKYYQVSWKKSLGIFVVNTILTIIVTLAVALPIRAFVFEPFVVSGVSMSPNIDQGTLLFIKKYDKNFSRGDVVVFVSPSRGIYLIQRIVGLPGERVTISNATISINGELYQDKFINGQLDGNVDVNLASDEYFVLADNVAKSALDSRNAGPIKYSQIVGKVSN